MFDNSVFSAAGIARIERELKIRLPERCREALLTTAFEPEEGDIHSQDFIGDVSQLIEYNEFARKTDGAKWPHTWLVIGYTEEDLTIVDTARQDAPVYTVDTFARGAFVLEGSGPTLAEWFVLAKENQEENEREYLEFEAKSEAERQERERRRAEVRKNRKWWQFWI